MKELSIEEKAKRYDEAIEIAKEINNERRAQPFNVMERVFPQLAESEDEKIRKYLINFFQRFPYENLENTGLSAKEAIAWLEKKRYSEFELENEYWRGYDDGKKQDEQKSLGDIAKEVTKDKDAAISLLKSTGIMNENGELADEYKRAWWAEISDKVEPKFRVGDVVRHIPNEVNMSQVEYRITKIDDKFYYSELEDGTEVILFGFPVEDTWELVEQKPVEPEPFEIEHGKYYYCIQDYYSGGNKRASKGDVVQALRGMSMMALGDKAGEYFLPINSIKQNPEWSKEDENNLTDIRNILLGSAATYGHSKKYTNWLKSLKGRCLPQSKQEWSTDDEFAIKILNTVCDEYLKISTYKGTEFRHEIIDAQNWLKSLRPQKHEALPKWRRLPLSGVSYAPDSWRVMDVITSTVNGNSSSVPALVKGDYYVPLFELEKVIEK